MNIKFFVVAQLDELYEACEKLGFFIMSTDVANVQCEREDYNTNKETESDPQDEEVACADATPRGGVRFGTVRVIEHAMKLGDVSLVCSHESEGTTSSL